MFGFSSAAKARETKEKISRRVRGDMGYGYFAAFSFFLADLSLGGLGGGDMVAMSWGSC